jgi:hypothetical protein
VCSHLFCHGLHQGLQGGQRWLIPFGNWYLCFHSASRSYIPCRCCACGRRAGPAHLFTAFGSLALTHLFCTLIT